jgi:hypothetical protein
MVSRGQPLPRSDVPTSTEPVGYVVGSWAGALVLGGGLTGLLATGLGR